MREKTAAFLLLTAILSIPALAGSKTAQMNVSVQVIARTILTVDSQPSSIQVTAADIARGYIDLPQAVTFEIRSNASSGYELQFQPVSYPYDHVSVQWGNGVATIGADGTWLTHPVQVGTTTESMSVRLILASGTQPGTYAWPLSFSASSL